MRSKGLLKGAAYTLYHPPSPPICRSKLAALERLGLPRACSTAAKPNRPPAEARKPIATARALFATLRCKRFTCFLASIDLCVSSPPSNAAVTQNDMQQASLASLLNIHSCLQKLKNTKQGRVTKACAPPLKLLKTLTASDLESHLHEVSSFQHHDVCPISASNLSNLCFVMLPSYHYACLKRDLCHSRPCQASLSNTDCTSACIYNTMTMQACFVFCIFLWPACPSTLCPLRTAHMSNTHITDSN